MDSLRYLYPHVSNKQRRQAGGLRCVTVWQEDHRTETPEDVPLMGTKLAVIQNPNKISKHYLWTKTNCFSTNRAWVFLSNSNFLVAFWDILSFLLNCRQKKNSTKYVNTIHANNKCGGKWLLCTPVFFLYTCPMSWRVDLSYRLQLLWLWVQCQWYFQSWSGTGLSKSDLWNTNIFNLNQGF